MEIIYIQATERKYEFQLKFDESFPDYVCGDLTKFYQVFTIIYSLFLIKFLII